MKKLLEAAKGKNGLEAENEKAAGGLKLEA